MAPESSSQPAPAPPRLLVVDGETPQRTAFCDLLRDHGYEITGVSTAPAALTALRERKFDLLLIDLTMSGMENMALLHAALELDPDLVGLVMAGPATIDTALEAMQSGALDYLLKPFQWNAVLPVLSRALIVRRLRRENAGLVLRVRENTAELEKTHRALESAHQELDAFSYSVSHDLRAPLRHVDGFAQLLVQGYAAELPPAAQRLLKNICAGAKRLNTLIDDLLHFSRLGRQPLTKQNVQMASLVQQVLEELQGEREGREVEIRVNPLPDYLGDPALLKQVYLNLVANALKFTRQRKPALIELGCQKEAGELVCFVRDNGVGFDLQFAGNLFGMFQRLHEPGQFEGTGMGLAIVQRIIHRHGGKIWAEAEVDKGATFRFTLPLTPPA